jgi:hypothetical protein
VQLLAGHEDHDPVSVNAFVDAAHGLAKSFDDRGDGERRSGLRRPSRRRPEGQGSHERPGKREFHSHAEEPSGTPSDEIRAGT